MKAFPDESAMERGTTDNEPIRGGSIALNRILGLFVERSRTDHTPMFTAALVSGYTLFVNVFEMDPSASPEALEQAFVKDLVLLLEYYDTYLSHCKSVLQARRKCPVYVYFPNYRHVKPEMRRDVSGTKLAAIEAYNRFLLRHKGQDELVKILDHVECHWGLVGNHDYPYREIMGKFRAIAHKADSAYHSGDAMAMLSHIPLDLHLSRSQRGIHLLERFTGKLKSVDEFGKKIDKEGRLPFYGIVHGLFGDSVLIKPQITHGLRKRALDQAVKERWISRSEYDVKQKLAGLMGVSVSSLGKYDFP